MGDSFEVSTYEVSFKDVVVHATSARNLTITNKSGSRLDFTVRVPCADKIEVLPNRCTVQPGETSSFVIKLRVARLPAGRRRVDAVFKEYIFFKTDFIEKRVAISYSLAAEQPIASGKAGAVSRSMEDLREAAASQLSDKSGLVSRITGQGLQHARSKDNDGTAAQQADVNASIISQLQNDLHAAQHQLQSALSEASFAQSVREELDSSFPDVNRLANLVMDRERTEHEARDARVLALLKAKDERISSLEAALSEARHELQTSRSSLQSLQSQIVASERERCSLSAQLAELSPLPALLSQAQKQVTALESRVQEMEPVVRKSNSAQRELRDLASEIERFRSRAAELEEAHRGAVSEQQRAAASNQELSRRAAVAEEQVDRLVRELSSSKSGPASHNVSAYISRITELENTNSILESSLQKLRQAVDRQQNVGITSRPDVSMSFEAATNDALKQRIVKLQRQLFQSHAHCVAVATKTLSLKYYSVLVCCVFVVIISYIRSSRTASQLREAVSNSWTDADDGSVDISPPDAFSTAAAECQAKMSQHMALLEAPRAHEASVSVQQVQNNDLAAKVASLEAQLSESKRKLRDTSNRYEKELKVTVDCSIEAKRCAGVLYEKVVELLGPHEAARFSDKLSLFNPCGDNFFGSQRFASASQTGEGTLRRTELELAACRNRVRELEHTFSEAQQMFEEKLKDCEEQMHDVSRSASAQKEAASIRIQELEDAVKRIGSKNDMHRRLSSALMECAQLRASDTRHWSEVNSLRERVSMYKADCAAMHRANESLRARLQLNDSGSAKGISGASASADEVASLRAAVDSQASEISRLEGLLRSSKIDFDRLHVVEEAAADGAAAAMRVRMLERDHNQLQAALSSRDFQVKILEAEILRGRNSNKHLKEQLANTLQSLAAAESRSLETQFIFSEQATAADLESQRDIIALQKRCGELEQANDLLSTQLSAANASLLQLRTEISQKESQLEFSRTQLNSTLRENEQLVQAASIQSNRADHETEKLLASLSESQSKLALLQQTVSAMQCEDDL
jgi:chromosome segregation ATPase